MPCGWIFAYIIGNRRFTKVAKIMVVHWHLTFLRQCQICFLMHLYGKNVQNFKWLLFWSLWANVAQISFGASLGQGNEKLLKWLSSRWPPYPYMVKSFKNLLLQNRGFLMAVEIIRDRRSTETAKIMVVHWHLTSLRRDQICFPMDFYGKMLRISNDFSSGASGPMLLKFHLEPPTPPPHPPGTGEWKTAKISSSIDQDRRHAHIW